MKIFGKYYIAVLLILTSCSQAGDVKPVLPVNLSQAQNTSDKTYTDEELRKIYQQPSHLWPRAHVSSELEYREIGPLPQVSFARINPYSTEKYNLGRLLFSERRLSGSGNMSCVSCHNPKLGWSDGQRTSMGADGKPLKRNTPAIINMAYHSSFFWDGRAKTPEEQAVAVLLNPQEMNSSEEQIKKNLEEVPVYKNLFRQAYGDEEITLERVANAMAVFERTIATKNKSSFDRFMLGDSEALTASQVRGLHLFRTKARCMSCHSGPNFSDDKMHNIGLVMEGTKYEDRGRYDITGKEADFGLFRTPSLRNVTKTAPYFHHGLVLNLNGLMNMYSMGMPASRNKSKHLVPIGLVTEEREELKNFLKALEEDTSADF